MLRINGSHHIYGKKDVTSKLSIPIHGNKNLKIGLLRYFMKVKKLNNEKSILLTPPRRRLGYRNFLITLTGSLAHRVAKASQLL